MRTVFEIVEAARVGAPTTHEECIYALLAYLRAPADVPHETWRPVVGFPRYEISDLGSVRNIETWKRLRLRVDNDGYLRVGLCTKPRTQTWVYVHRLVAAAFIGQCPADQQVNHINSVRADNRPANLEYVTQLHNILHAVALGRRAAKAQLVCRTCSRRGCSAPAVRRMGKTFYYCQKHYRFLAMRRTAGEDGKAVPSHEQLQAMVDAVGGDEHPVCPSCDRPMVWLMKQGAATVLTLQHDRSGGMRLLCMSCNSRHASHDGDSFYEVPKGSKRCGTCRLIKPDSEFYTSRTDSRWHNKTSKCKACNDIATVKYRTENRVEFNAYQRTYRAKRKAAGNPVRCPREHASELAK